MEGSGAGAAMQAGSLGSVGFTVAYLEGSIFKQTHKDEGSSPAQGENERHFGQKRAETNMGSPGTPFQLRERSPKASVNSISPPPFRSSCRINKWVEEWTN